MNRVASFALLSCLALAAASGCAATLDPAASEPAAQGEDLKLSSVKLPAGDPCRTVLGPLALGLADGAIGLSYAEGVTVSLTHETEIRTYSFSVFYRGESVRYTVELDNDSHSECLLLSLAVDPEARPNTDRRTSVKPNEVKASFPISVPSSDDCASTVKLLAQAVAESAVAPTHIETVQVDLLSETEDRDYVARVNGRDFTVNGETFANDYDFAINVSNDSAFKCFVQDVHPAW